MSENFQCGWPLSRGMGTSKYLHAKISSCTQGGENYFRGKQVHPLDNGYLKK